MLAKVYLKLEMFKDSIKKTDKLIDTLQSQVVDFEDILSKLTEQESKYRQNDQSISAKVEIIQKKGS